MTDWLSYHGIMLSVLRAYVPNETIRVGYKCSSRALRYHVSGVVTLAFLLHGSVHGREKKIRDQTKMIQYDEGCVK